MAKNCALYVSKNCAVLLAEKCVLYLTIYTATGILVIGIIAAIILVVLAIIDKSWVRVGTAIAVLLLSIWQRMLLYGFGELIDQTLTIAKNTSNLVNNMNNKTTVNTLDEELPEI